MKKVGKKIASWDECQIADDEVKYRLENWEEFYQNYYDTKDENLGEPDEDLVRDNLFQDEWEYLIEYLTEIIQKKNSDGYWKVEVENFGWRNLNGHKYLNAISGQELLSKILPKTDCTFYIFNFGKGLAIQNYHHDSPIGNEWYYLKPISEKTFRENRSE